MRQRRSEALGAEECGMELLCAAITLEPSTHVCAGSHWNLPTSTLYHLLDHIVTFYSYFNVC